MRKPLRRTPLNRGKRTPKRRKALKATARKCDIAWSRVIRSKGPCALSIHGGWHVCKGPLQAAHGFSRRYRGTRWDVRNGFPLCAAAHLRLTYDPIAWDSLLQAWWGTELYAELRAQAQAVTKPDYAAIAEALKAKVSELEAA